MDIFELGFAHPYAARPLAKIQRVGTIGPGAARLLDQLFGFFAGLFDAQHGAAVRRS